jgi:hypothetical protein
MPPLKHENLTGPHPLFGKARGAILPRLWACGQVSGEFIIGQHAVTLVLAFRWGNPHWLLNAASRPAY